MADADGCIALSSFEYMGYPSLLLRSVALGLVVSVFSCGVEANSLVPRASAMYPFKARSSSPPLRLLAILAADRST